MQSAPNYNKDLNIVICGVWYDPVNRYGYIEPVCTDLDYRLMGLGKAAVLECVKSCINLGEDSVYVESSKPFYKAIGFKPVFIHNVWEKKSERRD